LVPARQGLGAEGRLVRETNGETAHVTIDGT